MAWRGTRPGLRPRSRHRAWRGTRQSREGGGGLEEGQSQSREGGGEDWSPLKADNEHEGVLEAGGEDEDVGILGAEDEGALEVCGEDEGEGALDTGRSGMG